MCRVRVGLTIFFLSDSGRVSDGRKYFCRIRVAWTQFYFLGFVSDLGLAFIRNFGTSQLKQDCNRSLLLFSMTVNQRPLEATTNKMILYISVISFHFPSQSQQKVRMSTQTRRATPLTLSGICARDTLLTR